MGEKQNQPFQLSFNASLKVDFQGSRITSDGGLILVRELDERLGFGKLIEQHSNDPRGTNTRLPLADLLRQSVYSRLAGYEDMNDAERLSHDPRWVAPPVAAMKKSRSQERARRKWCLENPVPAEATTVFEVSWRGGSEPMTLPESKWCSVGPK